MGRPGLALSCWYAVALLGGGAAPAAPQDADSPRFKLDVEKAAADVVARHELPHFEERVEVRPFREVLDALLRGADLSCGASERGAPTRYELNPYRGSRIPVHLDFVPALKLLRSKLKSASSKEPRWFLYAVRREAESESGTPGPGAIDFFVREGRLREPSLPSEPGTQIELVAGFRERAQALTALRRLEQGFQGLARINEHEPPPPWFATPCPVPRFE